STQHSQFGHRSSFTPELSANRIRNRVSRRWGRRPTASSWARWKRTLATLAGAIQIRITITIFQSLTPTAHTRVRIWRRTAGGASTEILVNRFAAIIRTFALHMG